ncbi:hypothetical protein ACP70R_000962 [Stipagrostis hirtigluma subsp. patula]
MLSQFTGSDYSSYYNEVRAELSNTYAKYERKFGGVRSQRPAPAAPATGKNVVDWGKIFSSPSAASAGPSSGFLGVGSVGVGPVGLGSSSAAAAFFSPGLGPIGSSSTMPRTNTAPAAFPPPVLSELTSYIDSDNVPYTATGFDILNWWQQHKQSYPIISIIAKDVMTVPVSTISSESCFSLTGRIMEERRRRLGSETVEMLACLKDWEQGEARTQHSVQEKDLQEAFEEMFLEEEGNGSAAAT